MRRNEVTTAIELPYGPGIRQSFSELRYEQTTPDGVTILPADWSEEDVRKDTAREQRRADVRNPGFKCGFRAVWVDVVEEWYINGDDAEAEAVAEGMN